MERLTEKARNSDGTAISKKSLIDREGKGYPSSYASAIVTKLAGFEDLEDLIGVPIKTLAELFNDYVPENCKNPKKTIVLTDNDVDQWHDYKKAKEQDLILRLPCKKRDIVYDVVLCDDGEYHMFEMMVCAINPFGGIRKGTVWNVYLECTNDCSKAYRSFYDFGKTVFTTKEEAEQKLKELK